MLCLLMKIMGNLMPYGIKWCYLPPGSSDFSALTSAEGGTGFSDPGGMQGWVSLGDGCTRKVLKELAPAVVYNDADVDVQLHLTLAES